MYTNNDLKGFAKGMTVRKWKAEADSYKEKLIKKGARRRGVTTVRFSCNLSKVFSVRFCTCVESNLFLT